MLVMRPFLCVYGCVFSTHTHARTHKHTHTRTHARMHRKHVDIRRDSNWESLSMRVCSLLSKTVKKVEHSVAAVRILGGELEL